MEEGKIITLENNKEYTIIKRIINKDIAYDYLMTLSKPVEVLFAKEENIDNNILLKELEKEELESIINLFEN